AKRSVKIGVARDGMAFMQRLVAKCRNDLDDHRRRRGSKEVRHQLLEQVAGELRKFVFELELHARCEDCRALKQPADHRIDAILKNAAKPLGYSGILFGKLSRLLVQQLEFPIIQVEK